jgi:hypothetical protein
MSDIKTGDLVMLVGECCGGSQSELGLIVRVVATNYDYVDCEHCGFSTTEMLARLDGSDTGEDDEWGWFPMRWLRKIPPLADLETQSTEKKRRRPTLPR